MTGEIGICPFHPAGDYSLVIQPQTFTQLWREIQKRDNPGVGKTTVRRHLDKMVAEHVLVKRTKAWEETLRQKGDIIKHPMDCIRKNGCCI